MTKLLYFLPIIAGVALGSLQQQTTEHVEPKLQQAKPAIAETVKLKSLDESGVDVPVELARRELRLLDDMYKTSIVLITQHYVNSDDDLPAGEAFKLQFAAMEKTGWHEVKLLDATGDPLNPENEPGKGFETRGVIELLKGKSIHEEVITENDKRFLRGTTAIPVVMEKCIMCHDNYAGLPAGKAIGAISFKVPILDTITPTLPPIAEAPKEQEKK